MSPPEMTPSPDSPARRTVMSSRVTKSLPREPTQPAPGERDCRRANGRCWGPIIDGDLAAQPGCERPRLAGQIRLDDPQRLEPQAQPLAVLRRGGVEPGQLLHALEPVR